MDDEPICACAKPGGRGTGADRVFPHIHRAFDLSDPGDHFAGWPILTLTEDWQNGGAEGPDAKYLVSRIIADLSASKLFFCLSV